MSTVYVALQVVYDGNDPDDQFEEFLGVYASEGGAKAAVMNAVDSEGGDSNACEWVGLVFQDKAKDAGVYEYGYVQVTEVKP